MSTLYEASRDGDTGLVKELLDDGALVDEKDDNYGWTVLMWASWEGHTEVVHLLLDSGASLDEQAHDGNTALMLASQTDHTEVMKLLLDKGASVDVKNEYGNTALLQASQRGHTKVVKLLLEKGALVDGNAGRNGSALMRASEYGRTEVVKLLLDKGAPVYEKNQHGYTALMLAIREGHTEVVQLLLEKGALVDEKDVNGETALMLASREDHTEVMKLLLEKGASVDEKDEDGNTLLLQASQRGHTEVVQLLLEKGALVNENAGRNGTALMRASEYGRTEVVELLIEKGASVNEQDKDGKTALMLASWEGHTEVVQQLLDKGASVNEKDEDGKTALMLAIKGVHTDVVQLLLEQGASVDKQHKDGDTVLMWAIEEGHTEVVQLLLDWGASLDGKNKDGMTVLMQAFIAPAGVASATWASEKGSKVVQLLLDNGAPINDEKEADTALPTVVAFDEDQLGRMAAGQVRRLLKHVPDCDVPAMQAKARKIASDARAAIFESGEAGKAVIVAFNSRTAIYEAGEVGEAGEAVEAAEAALTAVTKAEAAALAAVTKAQAVVAKLTAKAVLQLVRLAGFARDRAREKRSSDPRSADDHQVLFARLQLAAAACVQADKLGEGGVQKLFRSDDGRKALELAVQVEAKQLLTQPVVQGYVQPVWRGNLEDLGWQWALVFILLLLQLLFLLPLVALVPALGPWLADKLDLGRGRSLYLLGLPRVKFYLGCAADFALALALTFIPTADLATAPVAPLLLVWVGSGLLWEGGQLIGSGSDELSSRNPLEIVAGFRASFAAYWVHNLNRVDTAVLLFSLAALTAAVSADDTENTTAWSLATTTSLRAAAVFLLWFRLIRVLLISPTFMPFVMMFFDMIFGDLLRFLVLLLFLLVAFAASWTVLLEPPPWLVEQQFGDDQNWRWREPLSLSPLAHLETDDCADELGGIDIFSTLIRLLEGALTGNDHFECARDSTKSPLAIWVFSFVYVMLTTVLLLNMLIAMMSTTYDNVSKSKETNYLFLFSQRTLALQNTPPTPPPLNVLGLPCEAICRLWARLYPEKAAANKYLSIYVSPTALRRATTAAAETLAAETAEASPASPPNSPSSEEITRGEETPLVAENTFVEKIKPLADEITQYIQDHQDVAAQAERWRTTMKRDMGKGFRKVEAGVQTVKEEIQEEIKAEVQKVEAGVQEVKEEIKEEIKAEVQKVKEEMQSMHQRLEEVHSKVDEKLDRIVQDLARLTAV